MTLTVHHAKDPSRRTPYEILELARELLGEIDLDPASDLEAQERVKAKLWLGPELGSDGLSVHWGDWEGSPDSTRVWLNPPGGVLDPKTLKPRAKGPGLSSAAVWWSKLVAEFSAGRVKEALFLGFTLEILRSSQRFGTPPQAFPFCVPSERLRFPSSSGEVENAPAMGSCIVYLGPQVERFREIFGRIGWCT